MRTFTDSITVAADPGAVFDVIADVQRWPEWTASMSWVRLHTPGPLAVGSRASLKQPGLSGTHWTVTRCQRPLGFSWVSPLPGVLCTADHEVRPVDGGSQVTLRLHFGGWLGGVAGLLGGALTKRYLRMEVLGLRERCEGRR